MDAAGVLPPLFAELNRRRVFRALIAYGIAALRVPSCWRASGWPGLLYSFGLRRNKPLVAVLPFAKLSSDRRTNTSPTA